MSKLYVSQPIDIVLVCKIVSGSLSWDDVVSAAILYTKPDASTGSFAATVSIPSKTLTYAMSAAENDQDGTWILQAEVTFPAAVVIPSTAVKMLIWARYT